MKSLALILMAFATAMANAATYPLEIMPKAECVSALQAALEPESTVASGLAALDSVNQNKMSVDSCLGELLENWGSNFPLQGSAPPAPVNKYQRAISDLSKRLQCYNPYEGADYPQAHADQYKKYYSAECDGKWLTKEEKAVLLDKKKKLEQSYSILKAVPRAFYVNLEDDQKKLDKENQKLNYCKTNPYPVGSYNYTSHQGKFEAVCDGKVLAPEDLVAQQALVAKLQQEIQQKSTEAGVLVNKLGSILSNGYSPPDLVFEKIDTLLPLATTLICTSPYPESSYNYTNWKWNSGSHCQGKFGPPSELPAAQAKFLAALGNVEELKAKVEEERKEQQKKTEALRAAAARVRYVSYNYRRLYKFFQRHLKNGEGSESLESFCEQYETGLTKEKKFFETALPGGANVDFSEFSGNWMPLEKYGLTEAENAILSAYIGNFYSVLNKLLYTGKITPEVGVYRDMLNSALDKIPAYKGDPLLRFSTLPENVLNQHQLGEIITYDSFTSTSKKKEWSWQSGGNSRFLIYNGQNGKDVSTDFNSSEQEVIFKAGTRFKVISKEKTPKSTYFILVEVDDKGAPMASIVPPKGEYIP